MLEPRPAARRGPRRQASKHSASRPAGTSPRTPPSKWNVASQAQDPGEDSPREPASRGPHPGSRAGTPLPRQSARRPPPASPLRRPGVPPRACGARDATHRPRRSSSRWTVRKSPAEYCGGTSAGGAPRLTGTSSAPATAAGAEWRRFPIRRAASDATARWQFRGRNWGDGAQIAPIERTCSSRSTAVTPLSASATTSTTRPRRPAIRRRPASTWRPASGESLKGTAAIARTRTTVTPRAAAQASSVSAAPALAARHQFGQPERRESAPRERRSIGQSEVAAGHARESAGRAFRRGRLNRLGGQDGERDRRRRRPRVTRRRRAGHVSVRAFSPHAPRGVATRPRRRRAQRAIRRSSRARCRAAARPGCR